MRSTAAIVTSLTAAALVATLASSLAAGQSGAGGTLGNVLSGQDAFGSWQDSSPGVRRLIRPLDLPAPFATKSASNGPNVAPMPSGARPKVPDGFAVETVAKDFKQPRVIRVAPNGDLFVADSAAGEIRILRMQDGTAKPSAESVFADGLNRPYGIAFYPLGPNPRWVYVADTDSVVRYAYANGDLKATGQPQTIVAHLPTGSHWTRDIAFSPDGGTMFVAVGSRSNAGEDLRGLPGDGIEAFAASHALGAAWGGEEDRADVLAFDPGGSNKRVYATGLRNCAGMTVQPATGQLWCVVNERDGLGDDLPPDFATAVQEGHFYGWPWYYIGGNPDPRSPVLGQRPDLADKVTVPDVLLQPHSAPLNIVFYTGSNFPAAYKGDAFVAMHGSWNRGARTGYKIVRLIFDHDKATGVYEDFMTGLVVSSDQVWGRPVGLAVGHDGSLFVSEDGNGTIWRISHGQPPA